MTDIWNRTTATATHFIVALLADIFIEVFHVIKIFCSIRRGQARLRVQILLNCVEVFHWYFKPQYKSNIIVVLNYCRYDDKTRVGSEISTERPTATDALSGDLAAVFEHVAAAAEPADPPDGISVSPRPHQDPQPLQSPTPSTRVSAPSFLTQSCRIIMYR